MKSNGRLGPYELNTIVTGDARELAKAIPDESVDLIFTDPVYDRIEDYEWLAETAARVLKDRGSLLAFCGHSYEIQAGAAMLPFGLKPGVTLHHYIAGSISRLFSHSLQCNLIPCLWFSKELPRNKWMFIQQLSAPKSGRKHRWGKAELMVKNRMALFTEEYDIVFDPFTGGGTIPAVCKQLNRQYLAFEIDPETAALARQRVADTQPPLPIVYPEQLEIAL